MGHPALLHATCADVACEEVASIGSSVAGGNVTDQPPSQPGWGPPPPPPPPQQPSSGWGAPPPPRPPDTRPWYRKKRFIIPGVIVALLVIAGIFGDGTTTSPPTATSSEASAPAATQPPEPTAEEPAATEAPAGPASAKVGETIQFEDSFGDHAIDVTVARSRVSTGGEFEKPDHGLYVGFLVRVKAFKDGISVPSFYVLAGGQHYDSTCCVTGFAPDLTTYGNLNKGEGTQGWVIFDVASRHGRLVMEEFGTQEAQAFWTF
jgi:hypothetical protein